MADLQVIMFKEETLMISDMTVKILALELSRSLLDSPNGHFDTFPIALDNVNMRTKYLGRLGKWHKILNKG